MRVRNQLQRDVNVFHTCILSALVLIRASLFFSVRLLLQAGY